MLLKDWLAREGLSHGDFAGRIGRSAEAVRRYACGERVPDRSTMPLIADETAGEVTANDFFGINVAAGAAVCGVCDRRADNPETRACIASNCGLRAREAA